MARSTATRKWVDFEYKADIGSKVFLAGSFNEWNATQVRLHDRGKSGAFRTSLLLPKGRHEYKYLVNGTWCADPKCEERVANGVGSLNCVINVA